jgi:glycosidase
MPTSILSQEVQAVIDQVRRPLSSPTVTPSPADWRDLWIYFIMVDRFNNPDAPPRNLPYDATFGGFQGGTLAGIRQQLDYLQQLGAGALWLTPVLKNCQFLDGAPNAGTYHGYGIQDFLHLDPRHGTNPDQVEQELHQLITEAHALGMYIIFDIVLNHTGDVFAYAQYGSEAPFGEDPYLVQWRDAQGNARADWPVAEAIPDPAPDAAVYPDELRRNMFFRRQGTPRPEGPETVGDFSSLKQLLTGNPALGDVLIRSFQYLIAKYDLDGFRIDTLKYLDPTFALTFGNAMREFALSIGKKNFFTYGEVYDDEERITEFIGRRASAAGDLVGVDAALDFPLFFRLPGVVKGMLPPSDVVAMYQHRKDVERDIISSHGEATRFFVTFLDNHDQHQRMYYSPSDAPGQFDAQATLGLGCLFTLPGIPCLYYGTEQGLHGAGDSDQNVREALWGKPDAFDPAHPFYQAIQQLTNIRQTQPSLRYGRYYFRPLSGDGMHFGVSSTPQGVLAFSRILNDQEVVVIANTSTASAFTGFVIVDASLNPEGVRYEVLFSNQAYPSAPGPVKSTGPCEILEVDGSISSGPAQTLPVILQPMEIQIVRQSSD